VKNQYVGDIGDYGKYALLRALSCQYSIGINWYLTPDDGKPDGRFTDYLLKDNDTLDKELFKMMKALLFPDGKTLNNENRKVSAIENGGFLPKTMFFNEVIDFSNVIDRETHRNSWVSRSQESLGTPDIVFLDPDNGLEVQSVSPTSIHGNKYVTYEEAKKYYNRAKVALIIYNHRDRSPDVKYNQRFTRFYKYKETKESFVYRLTFRKFSVRDYVFITKPEYFREVHDFILSFVCPVRAEYFSVGNLPMPIDK